MRIEMMDFIRKTFVILIVLMLVLSPMSPALAANGAGDNNAGGNGGNSGNGDGGNSGNAGGNGGGNGGGNDGNSGNSNSGGNNAGGGNSGGNAGDSGNSGGNSGNTADGDNGRGNSGNGNSGNNAGGNGGNNGNGGNGNNGNGNNGNGNGGNNGGGNDKDKGNDDKGNNGNNVNVNNGNSEEHRIGGGDSRSGSSSTVSKPTKGERKLSRESKLGLIITKNNKAKNDNIKENNSSNKSQDNLKNLLLEIPLTDESPYSLKQQAYEKVKSLQGLSEDSNKLDRIADLMNQSFNNSLWLDNRHIISPEVFKYDMHAAQQVRVLIDRERKSSLATDDLTYVLFKLIQADKMLAYIGMEDTKYAVEKLSGDQGIELEEHLDKAISHFSIAETHLEIGSDVSAIQHYNLAWNESFGYLIPYDALLPPQITIEVPASDSYVNSSGQKVAGTVSDVLVFLISNVSITTDTNTSMAPVVNGTFEGKTTLKEGPNAIEVRAVDYFGNVGTARVNVTLDTIPPQINITGIEEGAYYNYNVSAAIEISDQHLNTTVLLLDGMPYSSGANISSEGNHTLAVHAIDLAGNSAYSSVSFTIDRTPPHVKISYPQEGAFVRQIVNINGEAFDPNLDAVSLGIDGVRISGSADYNWDTTVYPDGSHSITIQAEDKAGNSASASINVTVDNTPPEVIIKSPLNFYLRQNITIDAGIAESNFDSLSVRIDGREISTTLPYELNTALYADGNHTIEIYAFDRAGNTGAKGALVNFDNNAPDINITSPINASFVKHAVEIEGIVNDTNLLSYTVAIDGTAVSNTLPYLWDTFASGDGEHTIRINAIDKAGNTASKEIAVTVDNTLPSVEIKFPPDGAFVRGVVDLTVNVFDTYLDKFRIYINGALVAENQANFSWNTTQYSDGAYIIELVAYDQAGNEKRTSINATVDNTAPIINITNPVKGSFVKQQVTVDADIIEANPDKLEVQIDGTAVSNILPYQWDTLSYLDGSHTIAIYVNDSAGSEAFESEAVTIDNTLPLVNITYPADGSYLKEVVNITGTASDANLDRISLTINGTEVSTSLPFEFNNSAYADGSYLIRLTAFDKANNSASDEITVNVDNTVPMLIVNELTENPTLDNPEYSLFIQTDIDANVTINGQPLSLTNGSTIYYRNITEGRNIFEITAADITGNSATWNITRLIDSDSLPDYYEINVTGTDPLDGDSDSSITAVNEAGNGIPDDKEDFDGDSLPNNIEMNLGTNPFSDDTDGDGLVDIFETYFSGTNPIIADTDGDGIKDGDEDIDLDGLTNLEEQNFGTNPDDRDTDGDNLFDGKEITLGTNPLNPDSDGDGLQDGMEVDTGSNPLLKDSDQDGIPDGKETITQEIVKGEINITITGEGDISNTLRVSNISRLEVFSGMPGNIGKVFAIRTNSSFESATIKIPYDESALGDIPENDLRIFTVNETTHRVDFLPTIVNTTNNYVQATTNHFSFYGVAGYTKWLTAWNSGSNPTTPEFKMGDRINIKAMVHNTGDAAISSNVPVYFYEGDPDAGGNYIGSTTITGGIAQGSSKVAIFYGYAIRSSSVDIYVKVDPLNSIAEKSESNNKAFKTLNIGPQNFDSDGDGLTDWDEVNGMRTYLGTIKTDPYNNDTDGDHLSDGVEMGMRFADYYLLYSNPKIKDSDNDSLNDDEEYSLNTEPLFDKDSDNDGLWDGEEVHVTKTSPTNRDTDGDGIWDGTEYLYSLGYTPLDNKAFLNGDTSNLLPAGQEAPVTVEDINMDMQPALEMAYSIGFEGVKIFCLGDFAEGRITPSGAVDTTLCGVDIGLLIFPGDGPTGEVAITSVKTARFVSGIKKWFNFRRLPLALYRLKKANEVKLGFKYVVKLETKPASKILRKAEINEASDLGIIWQQGVFKETLNAYGNLLLHYADDSAVVAKKIRELMAKKVPVDIKDMERVYENGGDLKKTMNVVERTEDSGSVIRWLEDGTNDYGWLHIKNKHVDTGDFRNIGIPDNEVESTIYKTIKEPEFVKNSLKGEGKCYYITVGEKLVKTVVANNGYIETSYPVKPNDSKAGCW